MITHGPQLNSFIVVMSKRPVPIRLKIYIQHFLFLCECVTVFWFVPGPPLYRQPHHWILGVQIGHGEESFGLGAGQDNTGSVQLALWRAPLSMAQKDPVTVLGHGMKEASKGKSNKSDTPQSTPLSP